MQKETSKTQGTAKNTVTKRVVLRIKLTGSNHKELDKCVKDMMKYFQTSKTPLKTRSYTLPTKQTLICIPASNFVYGNSSREHYKFVQKNRVLMIEFIMSDAAMAAVQDLLKNMFLPSGISAQVKVINKVAN